MIKKNRKERMKLEEKEYIIDAFTREGTNTNLEVNNINASCITSKNNKFLLDSEGNLTVKSIKADTFISDTTLNMLYPIGSIYLSVTETNPSSLFGGTWEQIKDKFLLSCWETYQNGTTGGEEKHTLTVTEMPSHSHTCTLAYGATDPAKGLGYATQIATTHFVGFIDYQGGNAPHNNMPPYLTVYMWKRIG